MEKIYVDTEKVLEIGNDINILSGEIKKIIDDIFDIMIYLCGSSNQWFGYSSEQFLLKTKLDKPNYNKFCESLNDLGKYLVNYAEDMKINIDEVRR